MYEAFFGLQEPAFSLTPDPRFLWLSETHEEGLGALCYGIESRRGFLLLTGEVGAGKTTLLRAALERVSPGTDTALVLNTAGLGPLDLFKLIVRELGVEGRFETKADYVIALNTFLLRRLDDGRNVVLVIDEAQNLDAGSLEEVRLLSNLETDTHKLLQIVLTGQPELRTTLQAPALRPLRQRIALEHHVESLLPEETRPFLEHRLRVAGGRFEDVFEPGVEKVFYEFSRGCPRLVNLLADRVLLAAYGKGIRPVPTTLVESKASRMARTFSPPAGDAEDA
jgi:general secretion pathway protein A